MLKNKKEKTVAKKETKKPIQRAVKPKIAVKPKKAVVVKAKKATRFKVKPIRVKKKIPGKIILPKEITPPEALIKPKDLPNKEVKELIKEAPPAKKAVPEIKLPVKPQPVKEELKIEVKAPPLPAIKELELEFPVTVKDLAVKLQEKPSNIIKFLMEMRVMVGINQPLTEEMVAKLCEKYNCMVKKAPDKEELALLMHREEDNPQALKPRFPIVTFMGHVDHGKTSLLDAIRKSKVTELEHGGITQHIGAYRVKLAHGEITFLDTPGHEAFTAMRARGVSVTDMVVLVVAADDGIMPQTEEAIDHARAAGVPIIVALNKVDKPQANIDRVKKQLSELNLAAEDWGGKTITVPVSAKTGQGIDDLLEMILLEAQMLELKANPDRLARGIAIEAKISKGRGPVATLLIQNGTLHLNETLIVGNSYGKIRAMFNDRGQSVTAAGPALPVEVLGLSSVPEAGEQFFVIKDEKQAKELAQLRLEKERLNQIKSFQRISLEDLHAQIEAGKIKELKLIIKADVRGSLEAIKDTLSKLNVTEIKIDIIHTGMGNVNTSDVILAVVSNALILGFNVDVDERAKELVDKEGVEVKTYNIIYELANEIKLALEGMLEPKLKRVFLGKAEIKKVFKLSKSGAIAGCLVTKGKIGRSAAINLVRNGEVVFEGKIASLKRFKDDVREVTEGFECGMSFSGFDQMMEGDLVEAFEVEKIARKL
jgi:translation initiation factor IF-2